MPDEPASGLPVRLSVCAQNLQDFGLLHSAASADFTTGYGARRLFVLDEVHTMNPPTDATGRALLGRWGNWTGRRRGDRTGQATA